MSCPFNNTNDTSGASSLSPGRVGYNDYLKIDDILKYQIPLSEKVGKKLVHDEYLFIIIHQTYELWFKLIIHELDSIRDLLFQPKLDEGNTLVIVSRLGRIVKIQKILVDQISILETLTPHDFDDFRKYLSPASGFQSLQFRLIENKLGVIKEKRIKHNNSDYSDAEGLNESEKERMKSSEQEHSLLSLIDKWLSRTPGLEPDGFDFTGKLKRGVEMWLKDLEEEANNEDNKEEQEKLLKDFQLKKDQFNDFFDEEKHHSLKKKGDRRLSFQAMQGALFIFFYRDEPRFNQPYQMISLLMDIDSLLIKWRYNHAILVQRMIGSKLGTGGSSGYQYLVATASDVSAASSLRPGRLSYTDYLEINDLLKCQIPFSERLGEKMVHDEYLFIIIHQTYELWFKLIIHELDSIRNLLLQPKVDEGNTLVIVSRLRRIVQIQKILVDQISVLETITPDDFDKIRKYIPGASGFQSLQFRLIENKLGLLKAKRIKHNKRDYSDAEGFSESQKERIESSEWEDSLLSLIDNWLSRTPGLEPDGFDFTGKFKRAVEIWLKDSEEEACIEVNEEEKQELLKDLQLKKDQFSDLFNEVKHNNLKIKGDRRLSFKAMQGALFIFFYRDEPRFNQPYQMISLLMDIDSLLLKWRYNHAIMVHRIIGPKPGTAGSSGYQYLVATASDRYKIFLDLFNLAAFIIPRKYMPKLDSSMKTRLSVFTLETTSAKTGECCDL